MWQVDTIERIRLLEIEADKTHEKEQIRQKIEKIFEEVPIQQHKLQEIQRSVRDIRESAGEEIIRKVAAVQSQQQEVETRLEHLYQKLLAPPSTIRKVIEEIQMWQEEVYEVVRVLEDQAGRVKTQKQREEVREKVEHTIRQMPPQRQKIQEAQQRVVREHESEETVRKLMESERRHKELEDRLRTLQKIVSEETFFTEERM